MGHGEPDGASTLQLGIGAAVLVTVSALAGSLDAFGLLDDAEPWHLVGGVGSAPYITAGTLIFPRLGALAGAAVGQRLPQRALGLGFALVLLAVAVLLLIDTLVLGGPPQAS